MKRPILLVNVSIAQVSTTIFFVMPVGILSIAGYLIKNQFNVKVIDFNVLKRNNKLANDEDLLNLFGDYLTEINPAMVGFSTMVAGQFELTHSASNIAKQKIKDIITVVGGAHVSQFPYQILKNCSSIDYVVIGEGERQSLALAELALNNVEINHYEKGLAYRSNGQITIHQETSFFNDLNNLPLPAYELLDFGDYHHDTSTWHNPFKINFGVRVPLITSRGCPNLCTFCSVANSMGLFYRFISVERIVGLIQRLYEDHNIKSFVIYDANFSHQVQRVIDLCEEIIKRNIRVSLDLPTGLPLNISSLEMIDALVEAGLIRTCVSVESGDSYIRNDIMKKRIKEEEVFRTISQIRKYPQVFLMTDFVMGMPEETIESMEASIDLIEKLDTDDIDLSISTPYPGTALFDQCERDGLFFSEINKESLYCSPVFCHSNRKMFMIKPYNMEYDSLCYYRDKILQMRKQKIKGYHRRMMGKFGIESNYRKELLQSEIIV